MSDLKHLLSPIKIKNLEIPNRCVMPPMGTNLGNRDQTVSDANLAYLRRQVQSNVGLIITEVVGVHPSGTIGIGGYDDRFIPGLKAMADIAHEQGNKIALQLHHAGREAFYQLKKGWAMGPSAVPSLVYGIPPKEMTHDDIQEIVDAFGQAAARAKKAGFDAVEIHGAHGYLLTQFLSAISNHRTDEYGGEFKNRARFVFEVVKSVRQHVGEEFPILIRLSAEEYIKNGYTVEDILSILPDLVDAGVDVIHASVGTHGSPGGITSAPPEFDAGWNVWRAKEIKEKVDIPVIAVGRFCDPRPADEVVARGDADMVAFGRQTLADPDFLNKAKLGKYDEIRKCLACNQGCIEGLMLEPGSHIRCAINPETGNELEYPANADGPGSDVWVIGGGPSGLVAAYEAARLGHTVTLFEKESELGGQIRYARQAPYKKPYADWIAWLIRQVEEKGIIIKTDTIVTEEMLDKATPDVVILASGGDEIIPDIPGIDQQNVCKASGILNESVKPGQNVLVIGGGLIGMETADFLLDKGSTVTVVEVLEQSPVLRFTAHGYQLHKRLRDGQCRLLLGTEVKSIEGDTVRVANKVQEEAITPVDQVVIATGMKPRSGLKKALEAKNISHHIVGDAVQVRRIIEATHEGARAAWSI